MASVCSADIFSHVKNYMFHGHAPAALPPRKTWYPLYGRLGGLQGWPGWVNFKVA